MARMGAKTAGETVERLIVKYDQELLAQERVAFAMIDATLANQAPQAMVQAGLKAGREPMQIWSRKDVREAFGAALEAVLSANRATVAALGSRAATMAADAIVQELAVCEMAAGGRYAGLAEQTADNLAGYAQTAADTYLTGYDAAAENTIRRAGQDIAGQFGTAERDDLMVRLFSPTPAGLRGFGGRGVWWRMSTGFQSTARAVAIQTSNAVRTAGMDMFNTLGETRGASA